MAWLSAGDTDVDPLAAESAGRQAGAFLVTAIHAEVDGAMIDPVQVLMDPRSPDHAVYAVTAVSGPLRCYVATAWGRAGHVSGKQIVSHGTIDAARAAAQEVVGHHISGQESPRTYVQMGTYTADASA